MSEIETSLGENIEEVYMHNILAKFNLSLGLCSAIFNYFIAKKLFCFVIPLLQLNDELDKMHEK